MTNLMPLIAYLLAVGFHVRTSFVAARRHEIQIFHDTAIVVSYLLLTLHSLIECMA